MQLDWPQLLRAGLQGLRLTPEQFWDLTPAELRLMLGDGSDARPMSRVGLDALLQSYPDTKEGPRDDER